MRIKPLGTMVGLVGALVAVGAALSPAASALAGQAGPGKHTTSLNRAGYGVTAASIKHVSAAWRQPSATCETGATYANFRISIARLGKPVAVGTATDCHAGQAVFYAWTNWEGQRVKLDGTVQAGDQIRVNLDISKDDLAYEIDNDTQGWGQGAASAGGGPGHFTRADILVQARAAGRGVLPLTNFGRVFFRQCKVNGHPLGTQHSHEIRMETPLGDQALPTPIVRESSFAVYKPVR